MQNNLKKIIIALTVLILGLGIFFGIKFYQNSKNQGSTTGSSTNTNPNRTPFQTRQGTSTEVQTIIDGETDVENPATTTVTRKQKLTQLWANPVSGFGFIPRDIDITATSTDNSSTTVISKIKNKNVLKGQQYAYLWDRTTGHIYENLASTTEVNRISNYTLPGVQEAYFADGPSVIIQKLKDDNETIMTEYIKLTKEFSTSTTYSTIENALSFDSTSLTFSQALKKIFYFKKGTGRGTISSLDGSAKMNAIDTGVSEWLTQYVNKDTIALTTKPSPYFEGYLFFLSTDGKAKNNYVLGEKFGFNTLVSPDGKKVLYNEIIDDSLETFIYDIKSKTSTHLYQETLVEKCAWSNDSKSIFCGIPQTLLQAPYPDAWYKNDISFNDNLWMIDVATGRFRPLSPLQDLIKVPFDVTNIKVSSDGNFILFQNKNDLSLWKYSFY